ncbi:obtusifoliol 14-alpha demethylase-like [Spinacia oleracea]|uniref:sterol 14alpha-demethylase n=1 Tax=Spinacia oleracea TaxID=3562 RepID=A0A9R0IN98_SPIOL|nr:obtusifoliol 14-alpha demethylase-like [Spinacia oleracea]
MMNNKVQLLNAVLVIVTAIVSVNFIVKWALKTLISRRIKRRLPPVVKGRLPLIGGVVRFVKNPIKLLEEEYENLGSVFTLNVVNKNITFLLEPQVSAHFFTATESELSQKEVYRFTVPIFGPGIIYDAEYSVRHQQFRFVEDAFRVTKLQGFVDDLLEEVQEYFSRWGDSGEVDLKQELDNLIILTASRCFLGREVSESITEEITSLINEINVAKGPVTMMFPYLPIPAHRNRDKARKKLDTILSKIIVSRKSSGKSGNDMLQTLIDSKYKDGRATTEAEITGMLITSIYGGQRTTSATAIWTGAYLIHYKKFWLAATEEQTTLMKKNGNTINYDVLVGMQVLYRCIKEALRLRPSVPLLLRQSHREFSVVTRKGEKYDIPRGHIVAASPVLSNRLPHIYTNPDDYDPERYCIGREEDKLAGPFSFTSFGGGRHSCLGEAFAYFELKTIWSHLLRNFELHLISSFPETDWNDIVWGVKDKVMVRYQRRNLAY